MERVLTFDYYGTLLNTAPSCKLVEDTASKHELDGSKAKTVFINYEDWILSGEDYMPYNMLYRVLEYRDLERACEEFRENCELILCAPERLQPFPDVPGVLKQ